MEDSRPYIVTFNADLDRMLGGGIPTHQITEFYGVPGIGKTQLGIQLSVDVQFPKVFDGCEGQCIYIDTEGSFVMERVIQVAQAASNHLVLMAENRMNCEKEEAKRFTLESVLSRIHYYRVHDYVEQIALINLLPSVLREKPEVKLIIIDSVAFHFRHDLEDMRKRSHLLMCLGQNLAFLAEQFGVAVVLMNQMTTKLSKNDSILVPALGEAWGYCCSNRVVLFWKEGKRYAHLEKSSNRKADTVVYRVTSEGIR